MAGVVAVLVELVVSLLALVVSPLSISAIYLFERPVFDSAREKVKRVTRQLEKPREALENSLYTCFKCESNKIFSIAKQVRSGDE